MDYRNFFTTIFSKELRNKNLLKFSPHLVCYHTTLWNLKCQWWVAHATDLLRPMRRCAVLLEYEIVTRYFFDAWQQLLLQQYFTIIVAVHFHSRLHIFIFQQDSAPAHRARDTIALLSWETPDYISPDQWPPNSPDMNPVDYKIWAVMQQRVYEKPAHGAQ